MHTKRQCENGCVAQGLSVFAGTAYKYTQAVLEMLAEKFPNIHKAHCNTAKQLTAKFHGTGSAVEVRISGRPPRTTQDNEQDISNCKLHSLKNSVHKLAQQAGILCSSTSRVLKKCLCLQASKITSVHEWEERNNIKSVECCLLLRDFYLPMETIFWSPIFFYQKCMVSLIQLNQQPN